MKRRQPSQLATSASAAPGRTTTQAIVEHCYGPGPRMSPAGAGRHTRIAANEACVQVRVARPDRGPGTDGGPA